MQKRRENKNTRCAPRAENDVVLQENGETEEDAAEDGGKTETSAGHEDGASTALVRRVAVAAVAFASVLGAAEAGDGDGV